MINFRSYSDLHQAIKNNLYKLPKDIDLIVGIPRSGLMAANIIALELNKPLTDIDNLLDQKIYNGGLRQKSLTKTNFSDIKKILVVDDSLNSGASMEEAKTKLHNNISNKKIFYCAIFLKPGQEKKVDYYLEHCPMPRVFEWNIFHHEIINKSSVDIDGILCRDPTEDENDDGKKYLKFIRNVEPKIIPTHEIYSLVTSRLEKYRKDTEYWLKKHNIKYKKLIMMQYKTKEERVKANNHAEFKAEEYMKSNSILFIESNMCQAQKIFELTGKDVFSYENSKMYTNIKDTKFSNNIKDKILVSFFSHTSELGGSERSLVDLIIELKKYKISSHVVLPSSGPLELLLKNHNIPYDIVNIKWWASGEKQESDQIINKESISLENLIKYLPKLSAINPDVIYSNTMVFPWGAIASKYLHKPHIWHIREYGELDHQLIFDYKYEDIIKFIEYFSNKIIVNSKSVGKYIKKYLIQKKPLTIYNHIKIDPILLKKHVKSPFQQGKSVKITVSGNIHPGKNQLEAIEAINTLVTKKYNVELMIIGKIANDKYYQKLLIQIKKYKLENRVHFVNFKINPYPYYKLSDIILITANKEAFGRTGIEGFLLKKVVIASKTSGVSELISNGNNGYVYNPQKKSALINIVSNIIDNNLYQKISTAGFQQINKINTKKQYGKKISKIIKKLADYKLDEQNNVYDQILQIIKTYIAKINNLEKAKEELKIIRDSKMYKLWPIYNKLKILFKHGR